MRSQEFYQKHLDRVSRSFAFCIAVLEPPFREWTSLAYLLCRVLDTVEDSDWSDLNLRNRQYSELESYLDELPEETCVASWKNRFPSSIPEGEKQLLAESWALFDDLHGLENSVRQVMRDTVKRMSAGMRHFSAREIGETGLRLTDLGDVNRYCYFVAGVVGELLSRLYLLYRPNFDPPPTFLKDAFHFGLFLQKINLLKDQRRDESESRFLVPDRELLLSSLRANAIGAVSYLTSLPKGEKGFRTFCAWSLFLGAASLPWLQQSYRQADDSKIPRTVTQELLKAVQSVCDDNEALRAHLAEFLTTLPASTPVILADGGLSWFHAIRGSSLEPGALREIGVC